MIKNSSDFAGRIAKKPLEFPRFSKQAMPPWWNGRHCGFKIRCSQRRAGSSPAGGILF